VADIEAIVKIP